MKSIDHENLEKVLQMELTKEQTNKIFDDWKAFYLNPYTYQNSIVVAMVKQYIKEIQ